MTLHTFGHFLTLCHAKMGVYLQLHIKRHKSNNPHPLLAWRHLWTAPKEFIRILHCFNIRAWCLTNLTTPQWEGLSRLQHWDMVLTSQPRTYKQTQNIFYFSIYSQRPKSELLVLYSDIQILTQFQTVGYSDNVWNPNDFIRILDKNFCPKTE